MKNRIATYSVEGKKFSISENESVTLPSPEHVKIKVKWVGICGSDLHSIETNFLKELVLGHEWVGEVVECGKNVSNFKFGDYVTSTVAIACGQCPPCKAGEEDCEKKFSLAVSHGMLRDIAYLPQNSLVKVPQPSGPYSTLFEILAVGENVFDKTHKTLKPESQVMIIGAGLLGLSVALVFKNRGYQPLLLEVIPSRIKRAQSLGLECRHTTETLMDKSMADSQTFMIDASGDHLGSKGGWQYLEHFGKRGFRALILAKYLNPLNLRTDRFFSKQATLEWVQGCTKASLESAIQNWESQINELGKKMVTSTFPLEQINEAFETAKNREKSGRVIIVLDP